MIVTVLAINAFRSEALAAVSGEGSRLLEIWDVEMTGCPEHDNLASESNHLVTSPIQKTGNMGNAGSWNGLTPQATAVIMLAPNEFSKTGIQDNTKHFLYSENKVTITASLNLWTPNANTCTSGPSISASSNITLSVMQDGTGKLIVDVPGDEKQQNGLSIKLTGTSNESGKTAQPTISCSVIATQGGVQVADLTFEIKFSFKAIKTSW